MNCKIILSGIISTCILFSGAISAQQTGAFDKTVSFGGNPSWTLSYYVTSSYNAANKYKLIIGLHGLGGNPQSMRSVLQTYAVSSPSSPVYNAIVVAPYAGGDANTDFWSPVSDTGIITKCITDAMATYNIDPEQIYLNGISLGGRSALRYGLINYWRFKGLELWCPAIQNVAEANNTSMYQYQNSKYIPICISVGSQDAYVQNGQIPTAMLQFSNAGGALATMQIVPGMGHNFPPSAYMFSCYSNINNSASSYAVNDARISAIPTPFDEECVTAFTPTVTIQNKGKNVLTSATINYQMDGGPVNTYAWSGSLNRLATNNVSLPAQTVAVGTHAFNVYTTLPNGVADAVPANDALIKNFTSLTNGATSLTEGFQGSIYPPTGWKHSGTDKVWFWQRQTGLGAGGSSACIRFDGYTTNKAGKKYQIRTAMYDFSNASAPVLTYDYAYAPLGTTGSTTDSLAILYSIDCGTNWIQLFKKGGMALSTTGGISSTYFTPTAAQWKNESINLSMLNGNPRVMFAFENRPSWGNNMYLDNINISGLTGIVEEHQQQFSVYPNPSTGAFTIFGLSPGITGSIDNNLNIYDVFGKLVFQTTVNSDEETVNPNLPNGMYFLRTSVSSGQMKTEAGAKTEKIIISK